jgi:hypothetical protein
VPDCTGDGVTCTNDAGGTCVAIPTAVGQFCSGECGPNLICEGEGMGIAACHARREPGKPCTTGAQCISGTCSRLVCAPVCTSANL